MKRGLVSIGALDDSFELYSYRQAFAPYAAGDCHIGAGAELASLVAFTIITVSRRAGVLRGVEMLAEASTRRHHCESHCRRGASIRAFSSPAFSLKARR